MSQEEDRETALIGVQMPDYHAVHLFRPTGIRLVFVYAKSSGRS